MTSPLAVRCPLCARKPGELCDGRAASNFGPAPQGVHEVRESAAAARDARWGFWLGRALVVIAVVLLVLGLVDAARAEDALCDLTGHSCALLAASSTAPSTTLINAWINPATHRLLVDALISGSWTGTGDVNLIQQNGVAMAPVVPGVLPTTGDLRAVNGVAMTPAVAGRVPVEVSNDPNVNLAAVNGVAVAPLVAGNVPVTGDLRRINGTAIAPVVAGVMPTTGDIRSVAGTNVAPVTAGRLPVETDWRTINGNALAVEGVPAVSGTIKVAVYPSAVWTDYAHGYVVNIGVASAPLVTPDGWYVYTAEQSYSNATFQAATGDTRGRMRVVAGSAEESGTATGSAVYAATSAQVTVANTATDVFSLTGSASKIVRVRRFVATCHKTVASATYHIFAVVRSTANSGGTSAAVAAVPFNSSSAAATATALVYTANPTLGTTVGSVFSEALGITQLVSGTATWTDSDERPLFLNSASEVLVWNFAAATDNAVSCSFTVEWSER